MTGTEARHGRSRGSARRLVLAVVIATGSAIAAAPASALTPDQRFIQRVWEQLPVLHVDRTDGFRPHTAVALARAQPARARAADTAVADDQTVEEPTPNALAGIDRCSDWEQPTLQPGFMVVVCNQNILTRHFHPSASSPSTARVVIASSSDSPTGRDIPPYVNEPDARALGADSITASTRTPVDVYVTETGPDGVTQLQALFRGIPASSNALHVQASGSTWALVDDNGRVIGRRNPVQLGCSLTGTAPVAGLLAGLSLVCAGLPAPLDVHISSNRETWEWQGRPRARTKFVLVSVDPRNRRHVSQLQLRAIRLGHHRFRASAALPRGVTNAGVGVMERGRMSVSRLGSVASPRTVLVARGVDAEKSDGANG